jgi:hypothetical protein
VDEEDEQRAREFPTGEGVGAEDADVRVTLEQTRQALEASVAEIERAKRLLRETEPLIDLPPLSEAREDEAAP